MLVAVNVPKLMKKKKARIRDQLSTGELMAILLAVQLIKEREIQMWIHIQQ